MRIALFGSGSPISTRALEALAARFAVAAVVAPGAARHGAIRRWTHRRVLRPLARAARRADASLLLYERGGEPAIGARLAALAPDLVCVATFPCLLPAALLRLAPLGAIGLHPSLLPRHRGPDPLFWTYFAGDSETGVSVLWLDEGEDSGPLIAQERIEVPRGRPGGDLYAEIAERGAALLAEAAARVADGTAPRLPQDESRATRDPAPRASRSPARLAASGAEWLWHFLSGLGPHRPFVLDGAGALVLHGRARGYERESGGRPGQVERRGGVLRLHGRDGWVEVERASAGARLRWALRRLRRG
jgi:methionyl-tRNA formyltransferase